MATSVSDEDVVEWAAAQPGASVAQIERALHLARLFDGVGAARLVDLGLRHQAGHLTAVEDLALAILAGREDAVQPLIDAAQEEYGQGTYRVPVRVVADWGKAVLVATVGPTASRENMEEMAASLTQWQERHIAKCIPWGTIVLPAGAKLEVYESAAGGVAVKREGERDE